MKVPEHLNPNIFSENVEQVPTRNGLGEGLKALGETHPNVVALCADLTESTRIGEFKEAYPERYIQMGIAEKSMESVASGMAAMGKTTIAYNNVNVKIAGAHAGVSVGPDGATHQAIEDIALMRVMPNMVVIAPSDVYEAKRAVIAAAEYEGPVYIRFGRDKTPVVTTHGTQFSIGKAEIYLERDPIHEKKVGIIGCGTLLHNALMAAKQLNESGIGASVMNLATVKPLDEDAVRAFAEEHDAIVTVEEHQAFGGMGSAVAEYLGSVRPTRIHRIGVRDQFGQSGEPTELIAYYGMDTKAIVAAAKKLVG